MPRTIGHWVLVFGLIKVFSSFSTTVLKIKKGMFLVFMAVGKKVVEKFWFNKSISHYHLAFLILGIFKALRL